jgi:hypothetical protein
MKKLLVAAAFAVMATACGVDPVEPGEDAAAPAEALGSTDQALHLGTTYDQCSSVLHVLNSSGVYQTIPRGDWTRVNVNDRQFRWKCGSVLEQTTCNVGTNYVLVYHSTTSRQITWRCEA